MRILFLTLASCLLLILSCRKDSFITSSDARLRVTADILKYDTVFVVSGSIYQSFKIINENNQKLRLSSVRLMGGNASPYKLNIDGIPGPELTNIELEANDSVYVFVQVNIDQNVNNLPFIVRDSIRISFNGNTRWVQLEAWGQNAHFFRDKKITANEIWNNDLPYVILGSLQIEANQTLTTNKGCRIYVHADAPIIVNGTLQVNGLKDTIDRVYFQGDRLDEPYKDFPASWPGIFFGAGSKDNVFNYAVLKNSYQCLALSDPSPNVNPKLVLNECIIDNAYDAGIISLNSSIRARNCQISNCGKNLYLVKGGNYQFTHCTVATPGSKFLNHTDPVLVLSNFITVNGAAQAANLDAVFRNCIFWGESSIVPDEVVVFRNNAASFNVNFDHGLWKVETTPANTTITQFINNQHPQFDSVNISKNYFDFRLKTGSPAIDKGVPAGVNIDLDGKPRPIGLPDLGCFEKQ
jgi:hypothetical protein